MNHKEFIQHVFTGDDEVLMGRPVLVALSGGADSVALLRALCEAGCHCHAAHCNFHLRGDESMRDERFVRDLCTRLEIPLTVKDFDVAAWQQTHGGSVEMACRELRYAWFEQEREQRQCGVIAVAHHADDQIETVFLNLLRGTGIKGLSGMNRLSGHIWRPLLAVSRQDILDYLSEIGQDFVTDSTNAQNDYRRNRLRNIVLPVIEQQFPHSSERILDTIGNLKQDSELLAALVNDAIPDARHIDIQRLSAHTHAPTLLYHRLRHLGFNRSQCGQAIEAVQSGHSGGQFIAPHHIMHVNRQSIDIEPIDTAPDAEIPIDLLSSLQAPIRITVARNSTPFSPLMCDGKKKVAFNIKLLDCQRIVLRHWRQGDRMKPFGLNGSKLVSDLFADLKLDHAAKRDTWLLEADGDILWVLGYRDSSLYPVERESQDYLMLILEN